MRDFGGGPPDNGGSHRAPTCEGSMKDKVFLGLIAIIACPTVPGCFSPPAREPVQ
jgi:hypothetical protein